MVLPSSVVVGGAPVASLGVFNGTLTRSPACGAQLRRQLTNAESISDSRFSQSCRPLSGTLPAAHGAGCPRAWAPFLVPAVLYRLEQRRLGRSPDVTVRPSRGSSDVTP